jgi:hypothetical protein
VVDFTDVDPIKMISTGDWLEINGTTGEVIITKKNKD